MKHIREDEVLVLQIFQKIQVGMYKIKLKNFKFYTTQTNR